SRAMRINGLLAEWQRKVSGESSNNQSRVVELLGANPFITIKGAADKLTIAFTTAQRAIERLERARIVKRIGGAKRDRVYCATALMDILEEPARLKPGAVKSLSVLSNHVCWNVSRSCRYHWNSPCGDRCLPVSGSPTDNNLAHKCQRG